MFYVYFVDFFKLMLIIDIMIGKFQKEKIRRVLLYMICSGLFCFGQMTKLTRRMSFLFLITILISAMFFCLYATPVKAEKNSLSPSVDSVNLRQDKWIYATYIDKNKNRYASVTRYDGDDIEITIPDELGGVPVKVIGREAFCNNKYIISVSIPDSVTEIGKYSFSGCIGLGSVAFPSSLRKIGEGAFYGCRSLREAVFPDGTEKIGSFAFYNCIHLQKAVFPPSLQVIGDSSFEGCTLLADVSFGEKLESVGDTAFKNCPSIVTADLSAASEIGTGAFIKCSSLREVVLGDDVTQIRPETFRGCRQLEKITFGKAVSVLETSAFEGCESLKELPELTALTAIGSLAFKDCVSFQKAEIGSHVQKIGSCAFAGCTSLGKIIVSKENESYSSSGGCLCSKDGSRLILCPPGFKGTLKLPDSVISVEDYAATGCAGISGVSFGSGVSSIGTAAFLGCTDIASLSVPDSMESIGNAALGRYFADGEMKKAGYLRVFGSDGRAAEHYCTARELSFIPYRNTLCVSSERVVIAEGKTFTLTYGFFAGKKADVSWTSSDESVVTVNNGKLSAISQGNAEITLSAEGFEPCAVKVTVVQSHNNAQNNKNSHDTRMIYCGESEELNSLFSQIMDPIFASDRFWYSSAPAVATVTNEGKVYAHSRGTATVTCLMPDGSKNTVLVTVTEKPAEFTAFVPADECIVGETTGVRTRMYPSSSAESVTWESNDESVATVDENGVITAVGQGKCTIQAATSSGLKSSFEIKCVIPAVSLSLDREVRDVYQGKEFNLTASVTPEDSDQEINWRSSDPSVASVNSKGKVTGKSFGSAVIYAETAGGLHAECRVNVITRAKELRLGTKNLKINCGTQYKLNPIVRPSYTPETTDQCSWNSTNEKVATVDGNGLVTAVGPGKCIINCRTGGDLISKCQVHVRLPAESVEIQSDKESIYIGETVSLESVITPEDYTDKVEWLSDNQDVARVTSGGTVRGRSSGSAVITVKVTNDVTGECISASYEITVMKKADAVKLSKSSLSMIVGENDSLTYAVVPDDCNDTVRWYSTDEAVASVRDDGLITAVSEGTCYICIETGSGVVSKCKVSVKL